MKNKIESYYDDFANAQVTIGINARNLEIQRWTEKFGLKKSDKVLEIGCGIGTQSELIAKFLTEGNLTSIDISSVSIDIAKDKLKEYSQIEFFVGDIVNMNFTPPNKFDMIILPDVIEHIPLESHKKLFEKLRSVLKPSGIILIHIPNPNYLQYVHENEPHLLQVLDQPIYTDILCENIYPNDLYIHYLETYSIWVDNCDYQIIILKPRSSAKSYSVISTKEKSLISKIKNKIKRNL